MRLFAMRQEGKWVQFKPHPKRVRVVDWHSKLLPQCLVNKAQRNAVDQCLRENMTSMPGSEWVEFTLKEK